LGLWPVVLVVMGGRAFAAESGADVDAELVRVQYVAPPSCPSEDAFWAAMMARTPKVRRADAGAPARTFVIRLAAGTDESTGHLVVRAVDGSTTEREVVGDSGEEVVAALALVAALAVDPNATTRPIPIPAPAARPPAVLASPPTVVRASPATPREAPRARGEVSLEGLVLTGASPGTLFGASPTLAATRPSRGWFEPTVRLAFAAASTGPLGVSGGTATFTSLLGAIEGCPHRWTSGSWSLEPCLRFEAGVLTAQGADVVPPRTDTHSWVAAGAIGRAEWRFFRGYFVEIAGGVRVPLVRTTFFFEPDVTIYRTAPVSGLFSAGLGLRFL
jgi:hypothetical protein